MIIILKAQSEQTIIDAVAARIRELGLTPHISQGEYRTIIGAIGEEQPHLVEYLEEIPGVERVIPIMKPYKLASRDFHPDDSVYSIGDTMIGEGYVTVMAGPCAIENEEMLMEVGKAVKSAGASVLRGGAFKPRTSPYSFQGLGIEGLRIVRQVSHALKIPVITEVMDPREVDMVVEFADIIQIGARNMQNYNLLQEVGRARKPVFLKRGLAAPIKEWLMSAEYILSAGNERVILCERGIRTFSDETRFTLEIAAIPIIKEVSHLPVFVDPSHAAGRRDLVPALTMAAIAAGADGVMIEVHNCPDKARCDGPQAMFPETFAELTGSIRRLAEIMGKKMSPVG
ncbi:MAG: 3-deoxy-7-phosphoheptulonate synthase [Phycisphaerae bacterium]|jgi:3-deoxy-7-phosphoheptulonate synthase|nr:3-deoxy-7-phosphoheptulonate synthase [Phycisphaerae bacterium]